jgi:hypothetical protein
MTYFSCHYFTISRQLRANTLPARPATFTQQLVPYCNTVTCASVFKAFKQPYTTRPFLDWHDDARQRRQRTYNVTHNEARSRNHCCRGKAISITYSECVSVALVIQHGKRMRCIILESVASLSLPYFSTLPHKRHDFRGEKNIEHKICVFDFLYNFCRNISHPKKNLARYCHKCTYVFM